MTVKIGSARSDERGSAYGGSAGDQTGNELSVQSWYRHRKGWRVFRARDPERAKRIAAAMRAACANRSIGYDQRQRGTLYARAAQVGFDPARVTERCETDCSALVRVCCAFAGIRMPDFNTESEPAALLASGAFVELKGSRYADSEAYLGEGDILCTPVKGHTVVALTDGARYEGAAASGEYALGARILRNGASGADVKLLQGYLIGLGGDLGRWGADGDFGDCTELAVRAFQRARQLTVDGEYGPESHAALLEALEEGGGGETVRVDGGQCWIRAQPDAGSERLGIAREGSRWPWAGETSPGGWLKIRAGGGDGWVSGKYGRLTKDVG